MFAWASEVVSTDNEERALVVALMNNFVSVFSCFLSGFITDGYSAELCSFLFFRCLLSAGVPQAYVMQCIVPNFVWKQTQYPRCLPGLYYSAALSASLIVAVGSIRYLQQRDKRLALLEYSVARDSYAVADTSDNGSNKEATEPDSESARNLKKVQAQ